MINIGHKSTEKIYSAILFLSKFFIPASLNVLLAKYNVPKNVITVPVPIKIMLISVRPTDYFHGLEFSCWVYVEPSIRHAKETQQLSHYQILSSYRFQFLKFLQKYRIDYHAEMVF